MRDVRSQRQNLSLIMNLNNEDELSMQLYNSPCKMHYSVNDSDWSEGIDLNLMKLKQAPLNFAVTLPPEMHKHAELVMSRGGYFT